MWLRENIGPVVGLVVVLLGFGYLFLEVLYPELKQASAVIALIAAVVSFYFGGMDKRKKEGDKPPPVD